MPLMVMLIPFVDVGRDATAFGPGLRPERRYRAVALQPLFPSLAVTGSPSRRYGVTASPRETLIFRLVHPVTGNGFGADGRR
jgi:hypothetical protein